MHVCSMQIMYACMHAWVSVCILVCTCLHANSLMDLGRKAQGLCRCVMLRTAALPINHLLLCSRRSSDLAQMSDVFTSCYFMSRHFIVASRQIISFYIIGYRIVSNWIGLLYFVITYHYKLVSHLLTDSCNLNFEMSTVPTIAKSRTSSVKTESIGRGSRPKRSGSQTVRRLRMCLKLNRRGTCGKDVL